MVLYIQQNNLFKAREEKYQSRIRVLGVLASGTSEESEVWLIIWDNKLAVDDWMALHSPTHKCVCVCVVSVCSYANSITNILLIKSIFFCYRLLWISCINWRYNSNIVKKTFHFLTLNSLYSVLSCYPFFFYWLIH